MTTATDDFSNDNKTTGKLLVGGSSNGLFETNYDKDWFRVSLVAGKVYEFTSTTRLGGIVVLPENGYDDSYWQGSADPAVMGVVTYRPLVSGDYFVSVRPVYDKLGSYTLLAREAPADDYGSGSASATALPLGSTLAGRLGATNDIDAFGLALAAGKLYKVTLTETLTPLATPSHYTFIGTSNANVETGMSRAGSVTTLTLASSASQDITLQVGSNWNSDPGNYTLRFEPMADDFSASADTVGKLGTGAAVSGTIDAMGDVDWFAITLDPAKSYQFGIQSAGQGYGLSMRLVDAGGKVLSTPNGYNHALLNFAPPAAGTYYLAVTGSGPGGYSVSAITVPDDVSNASAAMPVLVAGSQFSGRIDFNGDIDPVALATQAGNYYTMKLTMAEGQSAYGASVKVVAPDGSELRSFGTASFTFKAEQPGNYVFKVTGQNANEQFNYTLAASAPVADDIANTLANARPFVLDSHVGGTLEVAGDIDVFTTTLVKNQTYKFTYDADVARAFVYGPMGAGSYYLSGTGATFTPTVSGQYRFEVQGRDEKATSYGFTMSLHNDAISGDSTTSGRLQAGTVVNGILDGASDVDWYAVTIEAGKTMQFETTLSSYSYEWNMKLLDAAGNAVTGASQVAVGNAKFIMTYTAAASGSYYYAVTDYDAKTYTIATTAVANDDHSHEARYGTPVAPGQVVKGSFNGLGDADWLKMHLQAMHYYRIDASRSDGNATVSLFGGALKEINSTNAQAYWYGERPFQVDQDGDYGALFLASAWPGATGFSFQLTDLGSDDAGNVSAPAAKAFGPALGHIEVPTDTDYYTVHLLKDARYTFALEDVGTVPGASKLLMTIDSHYELGNFAAGKTVVFSPQTEGDYIIHVHAGAATAPAPYVLRVTRDDNDHQGPVASKLGNGTVQGIDADLRIEFAEAVLRDTGTVRVLDAAGHTFSSTRPLLDAGATSSGTTLTLETRQPFYPGLKYTLELGAGSVSDASGNGNPATSLAFTTAAAGAPSDKGDLLAASGKGAAIDGMAGLDTVYYQGAAADYSIRRTGATVEVGTGASHDSLANVERLLFTNGDGVALDIDGIGGKAYRLYQAAFNRAPDKPGVSFWMDFMDKGMGTKEVAQFFLASPEFQQTYGNSLSDGQFIDQLYLNVLHRPGEANGVKFWNDQMSKGLARADVLNYFAESPENVATLATIIGNGFSYTPVF